MAEEGKGREGEGPALPKYFALEPPLVLRPSASIGLVVLVLSCSMVIRHLPRPNLRLSLVPNDSSPIGRLRADVTRLHPIVDANMRITYQSW